MNKIRRWTTMFLLATWGWCLCAVSLPAMVPNARKIEVKADKLWGREEGDNAFRHQNSRIHHASKTRNRYAITDLRAQKLAMYHGAAVVPKAKPSNVRTQPKTTAPTSPMTDSGDTAWKTLGTITIAMLAAWAGLSILARHGHRHKTTPRAPCVMPQCHSSVFAEGLCRQHFRMAQDALRIQDEAFFGSIGQSASALRE